VVAEPVKKGEELFTHYVPWQDFAIDGWMGDVAGGGDCFVSFQFLLKNTFLYMSGVLNES